MLERDMEDLIFQFPNDFFPGHGFVLKGRQQAFAGVGRFDLLFVDSYQSNVLMELKAVVAKYENATQLAKYKEALEAKGETNILMWLVAPQIPSSVREFLDRIGIEYTEIHEAQFRRIAERHGVPFETRVIETPLAGGNQPGTDRQGRGDRVAPTGSTGHGQHRDPRVPDADHRQDLSGQGTTHWGTICNYRRALPPISESSRLFWTRVNLDKPVLT